MLNLRFLMKGTRHRPLRFVDFLTLSTQRQNLEWIASTSSDLVLAQLQVLGQLIWTAAKFPNRISDDIHSLSQIKI